MVGDIDPIKHTDGERVGGRRFVVETRVVDNGQIPGVVDSENASRVSGNDADGETVARQIGVTERDGSDGGAAQGVLANGKRLASDNHRRVVVGVHKAD